MDGLFKAIGIDNETIQIDALQALAEVPSIAYGVITEYIPKIGEATLHFMNNEAYTQTRSIMTFWTNLAAQEQTEKNQSNSQNIFALYKESLMGIIFAGLCITEDDDADIEETVDELSWTVSRACGALLVEVAALLKDQILAETIQFASGKLANPAD